MKTRFDGPDDALQALIDLRLFASGSGGSYVAQAGLAYGRACAKCKATQMQVESVRSGNDGLGRPCYVPVAKCRRCGARWPQVEANILRQHIGGGGAKGSREELLFLKARLEAAWSEIPGRVADRRGGRGALGAEAQETYLWFTLGVSGSWPGLARWMREQRTETGWTAWRARRAVDEARRAFEEALRARRMLRRAA